MFVSVSKNIPIKKKEISGKGKCSLSKRIFYSKSSSILNHLIYIFGVCELSHSSKLLSLDNKVTIFMS